MNSKYLWWGVAGIIGILGFMFLGVVGITPAMVDEGLESIRMVDPNNPNVKMGDAIDDAIHDFADVQIGIAPIPP
tara:strand:- start:257 stop:481 length:225 start_codon:yes stop_codon:yes gene_type:complete